MELFNNASKMPLVDFQKKAVMVSLKDMFKGPHFSICTIDNCCKILNIHPSSAIYNTLQAVHCVSWGDMDIEFKNEVFARTLEIFNTPSLDLSKVDVLELCPDSKTGKKVYKMLEVDHAR